MSSEQATRDIETARRWLQDAIATTRRLTVDLSPPILRGEGLAEALEWLRHQIEELHGLRVTIDADDSYVLPADVRVLLFQTVRELLFNVNKHAGTDHATVTLARADDDLVISVVDEGKGFDPDDLAADNEHAGIGLFSYRQRLELLGGSLGVHSRPELGTRIEIRIPLA